MLRLIPKIVLLMSAFGALTLVCFGQQNGDPRRPPRPDDDVLQEMKIKWRIKAEQQEFAEMTARAEEASRLSEEVAKAFESVGSLNADDQKKIDRIEKLLKKVRGAMGGDGDEDEDGLPGEDETKLSSVADAVKILQEKTGSVLKEVKKMTRHSISVAAIQTSNAVLKVIRFIRFGRN